MIDILLDVVCWIGRIALVALIAFAVFNVFCLPWVIAYEDGLTTSEVIHCIISDVLLACIFTLVLREE